MLSRENKGATTVFDVALEYEARTQNRLSDLTCFRTHRDEFKVLFARSLIVGPFNRLNVLNLFN